MKCPNKDNQPVRKFRSNLQNIYTLNTMRMFEDNLNQNKTLFDSIYSYRHRNPRNILNPSQNFG